MAQVLGSLTMADVIAGLLLLASVYGGDLLRARDFEGFVATAESPPTWRLC